MLGAAAVIEEISPHFQRCAVGIGLAVPVRSNDINVSIVIHIGNTDIM